MANENKKSKALPALTTTNFDHWERRVKHAFYADGASPLFEASLVPSDPGANPNPGIAATNATIRKKVWGYIIESLSDSMLHSVDDINLGEVEPLLRLIRKEFYTGTVAQKAELKRAFEKSQLADHPDIVIYMTHISTLAKRLRGMGQSITDEDIQFRFTEGLTQDYRPVVQAIHANLLPLPLAQVIRMLKDFAALDPGMPGHVMKEGETKSREAVLTASNICFKFSTEGRCVHGSKCRFEHVLQPRPPNSQTPPTDSDRAPGTCPGCGKAGHWWNDCRVAPKPQKTSWKKKRAQSRRGQAHAAITETAGPPVEDSKREDDFGCFAFPAYEEVNLQTPTRDLALVADLNGNGLNGKTPMLIDGGASCHIVNSTRNCINVRPADNMVKVGGGVMKCTSIADLPVHSHLPDGRTVSILLRDARIIPSFGLEIISEPRFLAGGCVVAKDHMYLTITANHGKGPVLFKVPANAAKMFYANVTHDQTRRPTETPVSRADSGYSLMGLGDDLETWVTRPVIPNISFCRPGQQQTWAERWWAAEDTERHATPLDIDGRIFSLDHDHDVGGITDLACSTADIQRLVLYHCREGHRAFPGVARSHGIPMPKNLPFCSSCVQGKSRRHALNRRRTEPLHHAPRPAYLFHMDVAGPFRVKTRGGSAYLLIIVDDYSRRLFGWWMRSASQVFDIIKDFVARLEAEFGRTAVVAQLKSDSATYFEASNQLREFCRKKGIYQVFSPPYTQALNGVAERSIGTVIAMSRTIRIHAGAPTSFHGDTTAYALYLLNRLPRNSGGDDTRLDLWNQRPTQNPLKYARIWGCQAWAHDTDPGKDKLLPKSKLHAFVGIDTASSCYRLVSIPGYSGKLSAHVTFNEGMSAFTNAPFATNGGPRAATAPSNTLTRTNATGTNAMREYGPQPIRRSVRAWQPSGGALRNIANANAPVSTTLPTTHEHKAPSDEEVDAEDDDLDDEVFATLQHGDTPTRHSDLNQMIPADRKPWDISEDDEWASHVDNATFGPPLTKVPFGFQVVPIGDVYKLKRDGRNKHRSVVRGNRMREGRDYNHTHATVANPTTFRIEFANAAKEDKEIKVADAPTAFLQAKMTTIVYCTLSPGLKAAAKRAGEKDVDAPRLMLQSIYGVPQGSRLWNIKANKAITGLEMRRSATDTALYTDDNNRLTILLWVDDFFLFYHRRHLKFAEWVFKGLKKLLKLPDWEDITDCLGIVVKRDRANRVLTLSQEPATRAIVAKFLGDCASADTPIAAGTIFTKEDCPKTAEDIAVMLPKASWYRSGVASSIHLVVWTRAEGAYTVSKLGKYQHNPGEPHIKFLKRWLRYLAGTAKYGLRYDFGGPPPREGVYGYYDAAFADDIDTRRTTMGYVFFFEGCAISWHSKTHTYVTTSTNHSEYCAAAKAAREAKFLESIYTDLGKDSAVRPIALFSDSKGAIAMAHNPVQRSSSKHIDLADHYAREQVARSTITIGFVVTNEMVADIQTKGLPKKQHFYLALHMIHKL
jgi:transposase InsO family protein